MLCNDIIERVYLYNRHSQNIAVQAYGDGPNGHGSRPSNEPQYHAERRQARPTSDHLLLQRHEETWIPFGRPKRS